MTVFNHRFNPTVLREYDIRGIVGDTLKPEDAFAIGRCFGSLVARAGGTKVAVGYDGRLSSPDLEPQLVAGLRACGLEVLRVGLVATPMLYFAAYQFGTDGAVMVTGSHNPPNYNGFKMRLGKKPFYGAQIQEIGRMAAEGDVVPVATEGSDRKVDVASAYADRVMQDYDGGERKLKVVWDPGNGSGSDITKVLAGRLPGEHFIINGDVDGTFPNHHPDPTVVENLQDLIAAVRSGGADLGIAFDGDGDRIGVVDGEGDIVWGDHVLIVYARDVLARTGAGQSVIFDVKCSQALPWAVERAGGRPVMWKTGHSLIKDKMAETGAPLAGEMSGHMFFGEGFYGHDDALYGAARLLRIVAEDGRGLRAMLADVPKFVSTPELRVDCPDHRKFAVVAAAAEHFRKTHEVIDVDGARVLFGDGWGLVRASNTQPILVMRYEARTVERLDAIRAEMEAWLVTQGVRP
jgi:phosphomannomutase